MAPLPFVETPEQKHTEETYGFNDERWVTHWEESMEKAAKKRKLEGGSLKYYYTCLACNKGVKKGTGDGYALLCHLTQSMPDSVHGDANFLERLKRSME